MKTIENFAKDNDITLDVEQVDNNPNMIGDEQWSRQASHYKTILKRTTNEGEKKQMTIYYSMGSALSNKPTVEDVLNAIRLDSYIYLDNETEEDFMNEFGYKDYETGKKVYKNVMKQGERTETFLGRELLEELTYKTVD